MSTKLIKACKTIDIGMATAVDYLASKGFEIPLDPNSRLTDEANMMLVANFSKDADIRRLAADRLAQMQASKESASASTPQHATADSVRASGQPIASTPEQPASEDEADGILSFMVDVALPGTNVSIRLAAGTLTGEVVKISNRMIAIQTSKGISVMRDEEIQDLVILGEEQRNSQSAEVPASEPEQLPVSEPEVGEESEANQEPAREPLCDETSHPQVKVVGKIDLTQFDKYSKKTPASKKTKEKESQSLADTVEKDRSLDEVLLEACDSIGVVKDFSGIIASPKLSEQYLRKCVDAGDSEAISNLLDAVPGRNFKKFTEAIVSVMDSLSDERQYFTLLWPLVLDAPEKYVRIVYSCGFCTRYRFTEYGALQANQIVPFLLESDGKMHYVFPLIAGMADYLTPETVELVVSKEYLIDKPEAWLALYLDILHKKPLEAMNELFKKDSSAAVYALLRIILDNEFSKSELNRLCRRLHLKKQYGGTIAAAIVQHERLGQAIIFGKNAAQYQHATDGDFSSFNGLSKQVLQKHAVVSAADQVCEGQIISMNCSTEGRYHYLFHNLKSPFRALIPKEGFPYSFEQGKLYNMEVVKVYPQGNILLVKPWGYQGDVVRDVNLLRIGDRVNVRMFSVHGIVVTAICNELKFLRAKLAPGQSPKADGWQYEAEVVAQRSPIDYTLKLLN